MKLFLGLLLGMGLGLLGCSQKEFNLTQEEVLAQESAQRGKIWLREGAPGPYKIGPGFISAVGTSGSLTVLTDQGTRTFSGPPMPGFFYEGTAYVNKEDKAFVVIRRVPALGVDDLK